MSQGQGSWSPGPSSKLLQVVGRIQSFFCVVVGYWLGASLSSERASEYFAKRSPLSSKPSVSVLSSQSQE